MRTIKPRVERQPACHRIRLGKAADERIDGVRYQDRQNERGDDGRDAGFDNTLFHGVVVSIFGLFAASPVFAVRAVPLFRNKIKRRPGQKQTEATPE